MNLVNKSDVIMMLNDSEKTLDEKRGAINALPVHNAKPAEAAAR